MANQITNNASLTVTGQTFSSTECPSSPADLHALFSTHTTVTDKGAATVVSETAPTQSDFDKLWLRVDSSGNPFAVYFRNPTNQRWEPANGVPIGSVQMYAGTSLPNGWLDCDGAEYDSTDALYEMLFEHIGTGFNTGSEAAGMFKVPDFRGRMPVGAGAGANLTSRAVGDSGGAESSSLTEAHIPPHHHEIRFNDTSAGAVAANVTSHGASGGGKVVAGSEGAENIDPLYTREEISPVGGGVTQTPLDTISPYLTTMHMIRYM